MLLEIINKIITETEETTETERYVSVIPESLQIRQKPEYTHGPIPVDVNPHQLLFIGKPMSRRSNNVEQYTILLTNNMTFRLVTEKNEKPPHLDLSLFINNKPALLYEDIKIQRNDGPVYRAGEMTWLSVKYKKLSSGMTNYSTERAPTGKYNSTNIELYNHSLSPADNAVKEIKLVVRNT